MNQVFKDQTPIFPGFNQVLQKSGQQSSSTIALKEVKNKPVQLNFNGGALSSDAGVLLLNLNYSKNIL